MCGICEANVIYLFPIKFLLLVFLWLNFSPIALHVMTSSLDPLLIQEVINAVRNVLQLLHFKAAFVKRPHCQTINFNKKVLQ